MRAEIISVGTELLLGDILNTNAQYLARELAALGFAVYHQTVVGDNAMRLKGVVLEAKRRSDVLLITGGLGPTDDDLTKETVAEAFGDTLELDTDLLVNLEQFFKNLGREMTPNNRKQAYVPRLGHALKNPNGTAPGAYFRQGGKYAFLLPGPPREMQPMFDAEVRPMLESLQEAAIRSLTLRVVGMGESDLETKVLPLLGGANPTAALYSKPGEVQVRITARAPTATEADNMCAEYATAFHNILGDVIFSADGGDLETTVVHLLADRKQTVALAESCTGGLLAERITSVAGASEVFGFGAVSYANEIKHRSLGVSRRTLRRHGAVSSQVAAEMAFGAAAKGRATFGVGITGIAGPGGGTPEKPVGLVYVAVAKGGAVHVRKLSIADRDRDFVRSMATTYALDMLRRLVAGLPLPGAKSYTKTQQADYERESRPRRRGGAFVRVVAAALVVIVAVALLAVGLNYASKRGAAAARPGYPTSRGLSYGTEEYAAAAREMIRSENELDSSVTAFVALPGGLVEDIVARGALPQQQMMQQAASEAEQAQAAPSAATLAGTALPLQLQAAGDVDAAPSAADGAAAMGADAAPGKAGRNTLLLGGPAFDNLFQYLDTGRAGEITTFTYYTTRTTSVYRVVALYLMDDKEEQADGFSPVVTDLPDYATYLTYTLGTHIRSLYDISVEMADDDSYMVLCAEDPTAPGRRLYLCGRLARAGETDLSEPVAAPAGAVLMPASLYAENGLDAPNPDTLYKYWMRLQLTGGVDCSELQLRAGMPSADRIPAGADLGAAVSGGGGDAAAGSDASLSSSASEASASGSVAPSSASVSSSASTSASGSGSSASSSSSAAQSAAASSASAAAQPGMLTVTLNGQLVTGPTATILAQICQHEAANLAPEAQKAVAVAAHSWILNQQGMGNTAPAVSGKLAPAELQDLIETVEDVILSGDGDNPAFTPWFRSAAEATNTPAEVWGQNRGYLESVPSPYEQGRDDWRSFLTLSAEDAAALVRQNLGADLSKTEDENLWFAGIERNEAGYVTTLKVGETEVTGFDFWQRVLVRDGLPLLPSAAFEVSYTGADFLFTAYGEGHGVGLSLLGADGFAREGQTYGPILSHYYPGTRLVRLEETS